MNGIAGQSKDFEDVSEVSEPVSEGKDSDDESSSNWKEKIGQAIAILESCEKNKILLGKKSRVLEMDEEDKLMPCVELTEKIAMLAKICRGMNEDRGKLKESRSNVSNQATDLAKELTAERKKSGLLEEKLGETEKVLKLLFDESHDLKDICEKAIAKGKALEEYGRNLIEAKRLLESKVADCDKKFADRGSELQLLEERLLRQSAEQLPHAQVQFPGEKKTFSQQKAEFEEDVAHLQKSFMTQQNQWSVECYAQALDLKDAYSDCDAHCNRIKELETKLERIEALRDCESEVEIFREEVRSNVEETIGSHEAIGIKELGGQKLDPGSEVQQLRAQIFEERSIRAGLEDLRQRREAENREYLKELEERKIGMANLERDVDLKQRMYEMKDEELAKLKQEKNALSAEVEKLKQQCETEAQHTAALKSRLDILMEEKNRLLEEMAKIKEKNVNHKSCNDELKGKNQELNSASEASREEVLKLKESVEKLKHQVGRLQDEALEENVGQGDLSDETGASTENSKKGQSMPQSKAAKGNSLHLNHLYLS